MKNNIELKVGTKIIAHWDKATSEIVAIDGDIVTYKCYAYDAKELFEDGLFRDITSVIYKCFDIVE